jgi:hypothetical protein
MVKPLDVVPDEAVIRRLAGQEWHQLAPQGVEEDLVTQPQMEFRTQSMVLLVDRVVEVDHKFLEPARGAEILVDTVPLRVMTADKLY